MKITDLSVQMNTLKKNSKVGEKESHPWKTREQTLYRKYIEWLSSKDREILLLESLTYGGDSDNLTPISFFSEADKLALSNSDNYIEKCLGLTNKVISSIELEEPYYTSL